MASGNVEVFEHISLADKNSFQIGGYARWYCRPESDEQLSSALTHAHTFGKPVFVLGKGSNVLISDSGWPGMVVHFCEVTGKGVFQWDLNTVTVAGPVALNALVKESVDRGFAGVEELAGIPGTVGGAVVMNAGAFSSCIADTLSKVSCVDPVTGAIVVRCAAELHLGYRTSALQQTGEIVTSASFTFLRSALPGELDGRRRDILDRRRQKQPLDFPNCGSVFKRPAGNYAGTLIEQCGLKGFRVGGAEVSTKHANFIINTGRAKAAEVRRLIVSIQKRVFEETGILLEPEVIFVGEFDEPLFNPTTEIGL